MMPKRARNFMIANAYPVFRHVQHLRARRRQGTEIALISGKDVSSSDQQSLVFFTCRKAGSSFLFEILKEFSKTTGLKSVDFATYFTSMNLSPSDKFKDKEFLETAFRNSGFFYGPVRFYADIPDLESYRVLLVLRDPRDVVVSDFYSMRYSHPMLNPSYIKMRQMALSETIDEFVTRIAPDYAAIFGRYADALMSYGHVVYRRYEDIMNSPLEALETFCDLLGANISRDQCRTIAEEQMSLPTVEDVHAHRRSGRSGQYRERLLPETIDVLNRTFEPVLPILGYGDDAPSATAQEGCNGAGRPGEALSAGSAGQG